MFVGLFWARVQNKMWSRRESNPRPIKVLMSFLHVYFLISSRSGQSSRTIFYTLPAITYLGFGHCSPKVVVSAPKYWGGGLKRGTMCMIPQPCGIITSVVYKLGSDGILSIANWNVCTSMFNGDSVRAPTCLLKNEPSRQFRAAPFVFSLFAPTFVGGNYALFIIH